MPSDLESASMHVVSAGGGRRILAVQAGVLREVPLSGDFAWRITGPRTCIGSWSDGGPLPCPIGCAVGHEAQCLPCSGLERPECVFEPLCQTAGIACACPFGVVPHVVYIGFYGTLAKVGMTQERRVRARLREQGADAWIVVAREVDRASARLTERAIHTLWRIPEWRGWRETLPQLARPVPWPQLEQRAQAVAASLAPRFQAGPLERILDHPIAQPLGGVPRRVYVDDGGEHAGTWVGAKGPHLIYREAPHGRHLGVGHAPLAAIRHSELLGHHVEMRSTASARQALASTA